jgi:hypothetical protein
MALSAMNYLINNESITIFSAILFPLEKKDGLGG